MNEQEIKELNKAISKLSEEDQALIAGGTINDEQCEAIKGQLCSLVERPPVLLAYGGRVPKLVDLPKAEPVKPEEPVVPTEPATKE